MKQFEEVKSSFSVLSNHVKVIEEAAISSFIQDGPYLELFIRQNADDLTFLKNSKLKPFYKTAGINHPAFKTLEKDTLYEELKEDE